MDIAVALDFSGIARSRDGRVAQDVAASRRMGVGSGEALNDLDDLVTSVALEPAELNELADLPDDDTLLGRAGHGDPTTALEVEKPLVSEYVEGPQDSVLVHAEHRGQVLGQRKSIAWTSFALGDRSANLGGHLIVQGDRL